MSVLNRFTDIISANVNSLIDRMEDPEKMIDEYLRQMTNDLAEVKDNTASVMAEETRAKRELDANEAEIKKYEELARKAVQAGNDDDARVFLTKKQEIEDIGANLASSYASAHENAVKMRQMHDKLAQDIETLRQRRAMIKGKLSVAQAQEKVNQAAGDVKQRESARSNFERMEAKADRLLDEANAKADLNTAPANPVQSLEEKYANETASAAVEDELARLKQDMGM
ncbi:phage shock protein A [Suicoccus acidiformans]|uniref:Phage shock protein A n=1 Tax=Suicoccus acidiformans TaxID=2036206 RepID=A0A347WJX8_9LACT|nr:PspA/IM30 family protein [Suicoccus acidiformans]AXY25385.1 phage shock protein A [Suicoccus acidiformans]